MKCWQDSKIETTKNTKYTKKEKTTKYTKRTKCVMVRQKVHLTKSYFRLKITP